MTQPTHRLLALARLYGIQPSYRSYLGEPAQASTEALLAVLAALGLNTPLDPHNPEAAITAREQELWDRRVPPVLAHWPDHPATLRLRLPKALTWDRAEFHLAVEDGNVREWAVDAASHPAASMRAHSGGARQIDVTLPNDLPPGYHTLHTTVGGEHWQTLVIAAPQQAWQPEAPDRWWGTFLPLYSLRTERPWGAGDYTDLRRLAEWTGSLGGQLVGTLPLLPAFLGGEPYDPSPYSPASRLAWNEFYLDVEAAPELAASPEATDLLGSAAFRQAVQAAAGSDLVDYQHVMSLKRRVLEALAAAFFTRGSTERRGQFDAFLAERPHLADYARFRAAGEHLGRPWQAWPDAARNGTLASGDWDPTAERYHLYVQWLADQQVGALAHRADGGAAGLYFDLPLGVHASSYDTWRERPQFAMPVAAGAPPDALFSQGQNWGFPPLHPTAARQAGHSYFIAVLRHHLRYARALRLDHVMGLYRQYWVPAGFAATDGAYVRYPAEELAAIVCLESVRAEAVVVGENLGTVPQKVDDLMARRALRPLYVLQFSGTGDPDRAFHRPDGSALASLNTHDTPTWAGWWRHRDIEDQVALGLIDQPQADSAHAQRDHLVWCISQFLITHNLAERTNGGEPPVEQIAADVLRWLAGTDAWAVLVNLEDLLGEERPQNVPGTYRERPNWLRKATETLEGLLGSGHIEAALRAVDAARKRTG